MTPPDSPRLYPCENCISPEMCEELSKCLDFVPPPAVEVIPYDWEMDAVVENHLAELSTFKHPPYPDYQRLVETTARQYAELRQLAKKFGAERDALRSLGTTGAQDPENGKSALHEREAMTELTALEELQRDNRQLLSRLEEQTRIANDCREAARSLRYILRGITDKSFNTHVTLSPEIFDKNSFEAVQMIVKNHAQRSAYEIEKLLLNPLARLRDALLHINYLENHAQSRGLPFAPFGLREHDYDIMNSL